MRLTLLAPLAGLLPTLLATPTPGPYSVGPYSYYSSNIPAAPFCPPRNVNPSEQHAIFFDFIDKLYVKQNATDAYLTYVSPDYINHSPYAPQGRAAAIAFLSFLIPSLNRTILHETFENNIGMVHLKVNSRPLLALVDLFRMNGSCIVEHWDVNQALPANATNPIALF